MNQKTKDYRLIEKDGLTIEVSDPTIYQIHFSGEKVIILRRYKDGKSMSECPPMRETFFHNLSIK